MAQNDEEESTLSATPYLPTITNTQSMLRAAGGVKSASPDLILFDDTSLPIIAMTDMIFEDIGGQEIINILRHDTVDGINLNYNLISNSQQITNVYRPSKLSSAPGTLKEFFQNFAIRLDTHQPETQSVNNSDHVYLDNEEYAGSLVVQVTNMQQNEQIEVQVLNSGDYLDGII